VAEFHIGSQQATNIYQADSITIGSPPPQTPEEALALGLRLLGLRDYETSRRSFERAAGDPVTEVRARFGLAVALLAENRLRLKKEQKILKAWKALERILELVEDDPGALLLAAVLREGYYEANGYRTPPPLLRLPPPSAPAPGAQIALITEHVMSEESTTWRRLRAGAEGTA